MRSRTRNDSDVAAPPARGSASQGGREPRGQLRPFKRLDKIRTCEWGISVEIANMIGREPSPTSSPGVYRSEGGGGGAYRLSGAVDTDRTPRMIFKPGAERNFRLPSIFRRKPSRETPSLVECRVRPPTKNVLIL